MAINKGNTADEFVPEQLRAKAELYAERNALYGDNYKKFGYALHEMMPEVVLSSPDDLNRFAVLVMIFAKVTRYAEMFARGGHDDSLDDICVYSMMLKELDEDARKRKEDE